MNSNKSTAGHVMVLTPGGYRPSSQVFITENNIPAGRAVSRRRNVLMGADLAPDRQPGTGWVAYTAWMNGETDPIESFTAKWRVPPPPAVDSGQTIFMFIGLQNTQFILQPVLQWGPSHAGGGSFWSIATWYTDGTSQKTFCSQAKPVPSDKELTARIDRISQNGRSFTYKVSFEEFPEHDRQYENVIELLWAFVVLEAYQVNGIHSYPATPVLSISPLTIKIDSAPVTPAWAILPRGNAGSRPCAALNATGVDLVF